MKKIHVSLKFIQKKNRQRHTHKEVENGKEVVKSKTRSASVYLNKQIQKVWSIY